MSVNSPQASIFRVADLPQNRPTGFDLRPDPAELDEIGEGFDLISLRKMRFSGQIRALGKNDWEIIGHLGATVVQPCVVTLSPVTTRIEADVQRLYLARFELPEEFDGEAEMPEDENAEQLGAEIDLDQVMREALALNLPAYPRAEDASLGEAVYTEPGKEPLRDEDARPFASLAALRDKLSDKDEDEGEK